MWEEINSIRYYLEVSRRVIDKNILDIYCNSLSNIFKSLHIKMGVFNTAIVVNGDIIINFLIDDYFVLWNYSGKRYYICDQFEGLIELINCICINK